MTSDRNAVRAGFFMLISVALMVIVIVGISGISRFIEPGQLRTAHFKLSDDLGGLRVGDDVRIGGFKVGSIHHIYVDTETQKIDVVFSLPRRYVLKTGSRLAIQGTVTGATWLNFDSLGAGNAIGPEVELIGNPSASTVLLARLSTLAPRVEAIVTDVQEKTIPNADDTLVRFGKTADTGTQALAEIRDFIGPTKTDFKTTMANLGAVTDSAKEKLPAIMDQVSTFITHVDTTVQNVSVTLQNIEATAENAKDLTAAARSVIVGNRGKLDGLIANLKITSDNLKGATAEIRRSPWRLLYKPAPNEMGNLNLYDSARQFADGANDLNDAVEALRDALHDHNASDTDVKKLLQRIDASFSKFGEVETKLWDAVKQ